MTPQDLLVAAQDWRQVHEQIHGPLDAQTAETVNEVIEYLVNCMAVSGG